MSGKKLTFSISLFFIAILVAVGFIFFFRPKPADKIKVRLGWVVQATFTGLFVAREKGYYKDAGLSVDLLPFKQDLNIIDEVAKKQVDIGITSPIEILTARQQGKKVKAIMQTYQISPLAFVSLKSSHLTSPLDLKGKILGNKGGNEETLEKYLAVLKSVGLTKKDVTFKTTGYDTSHIDDLVNKTVDTIDVYRVEDVFPFQKKGIAYNIIKPEDYEVTGSADTFTVSDEAIQAKPEVFQRFVQATDKGWNYAFAHQAEALAILKKYEDPSYSEPGLEAYALQESIPLIQPTGGRFIGSMDFQTWNETAVRMKTAGLLNGDFDVSTAYTQQFFR